MVDPNLDFKKRLNMKSLRNLVNTFKNICS